MPADRVPNEAQSLFELCLILKFSIQLQPQTLHPGCHIFL